MANEGEHEWQEDWDSDDDDDGPDEVWVEPEHFRQFLTAYVQANQPAALQTLDLHPGLLNERWRGEEFDVVDDRYVDRGETAILAASQGGSEGLVVELLKRGADWKARDEYGCDALFLASCYGHVVVATVLLGRGCDPNTRSDIWTALGIAAADDSLPVCILLLSKAADLYAPMPRDGRTALQLYGLLANTPLTPAVLRKRRALLQHAYDEGPHPNARWARRWPFMQVMVCYDFQPLAARRAVLLAPNPPLPTNVAIPAIPIGTQEQYRAYLHGLVFSHPGFWKLIASYI
jgi:Ankyrin repeats (3 copies)